MAIRCSAIFAAASILSSVTLCAAEEASGYPGQGQPNPADWPTYARDLAGTRYAPLTQINAANVGKADSVLVPTGSLPRRRRAADAWRARRRATLPCRKGTLHRLLAAPAAQAESRPAYRES